VFPPVLLLLFAASFKVFEDASAQLVHEDASFLGLFSGPDAPLVDAGAPVGIANNTSYGAAWELIIIYIIAIALMYASMKIATNIARQEQVKVPTTGQFYGAYRKVAPAVFKGAAGAAKVVGRIPVPFVKDNIGQLFTRNLQLQSKVLLPAGRLLSPEARREKAVSKKRVDAYRGARDDAEKKKGTPEYENALIGAAERWDRLTDVEKTTEKNSNVLKKDKKKQDVQYDVEANAGQTGRTVVQTAQGGAPVPQQSAAEKAQATTNATVNAIKDMDKHQAATYLATKNLEILDMMKEKTYAQAFVGALRTQGKVASLPPEVLKHPNVAPELHLTEVVEIAGDKERFSDDQFVEIMGNVSEDVHKRFKTHPAKAGRKKAMKRVPDARKRAMKRLEDSRKNPEPADETNS